MPAAPDALLAEQSVTRAAARLHTSPAAVSRTLARLRRILQDPAPHPSPASPPRSVSTSSTSPSRCRH
ncbi:LysR family transcriptional regulator [Microbispora siamensis]